MDVTHFATRNGNSFRINIPGKGSEMLVLTSNDGIIAFVQGGERVFMEKLKQL